MRSAIGTLAGATVVAALNGACGSDHSAADRSQAGSSGDSNGAGGSVSGGAGGATGSTSGSGGIGGATSGTGGSVTGGTGGTAGGNRDCSPTATHCGNGSPVDQCILASSQEWVVVICGNDYPCHGDCESMAAYLAPSICASCS